MFVLFVCWFCLCGFGCWPVLHISQSEIIIYSVQHIFGSYDLASLLNMDYEKPTQKRVIDSVASEMDADSDWDETIALERGYKTAGLKRYKLDVKLLNNTEEVDQYSEAFVSGTARAAEKNSLEDRAGRVQHHEGHCREVPETRR